MEGVAASARVRVNARRIEGRPRNILWGDDRDRLRPDDAERWIVVAKPAFEAWRIGMGDLIGHVRIVGKRDEAVAEAFRDVELAPVLG